MSSSEKITFSTKNISKFKGRHLRVPLLANFELKRAPNEAIAFKNDQNLMIAITSFDMTSPVIWTERKC